MKRTVRLSPGECRSRNVFVLFLLAAMLIVLPSAAQAATFTVNSTADEVDADPGNGICAAAGGACTLRAAIQEANALAGADTIIVPAGTYTLTLAGAGENLAATGDLDISDNIAIRGAGADSTIIQAGTLGVGGPPNGIDRVFDISGPVTVNITGITVRNGMVIDNSGGVEGNGGGILNNGGTLTITDSTISGNTAIDSGGAVYDSGGALSITNSTISGNTSQQGSGIFSNGGTIMLLKSTLSNNLADGDGGGIYMNNPGTDPHLTITNSTLSGNSAIGGVGGGVLCGGTILVTNSTIAGNMSSGTGGGIFNVGGMTLFNTIVADSTGSNCSGTIINGGNNIDSGSTCGWGTNMGSMSDTSPLLGKLADNGGQTQTMALLTGSPAIDGVTYGSPNGSPATDQRGVVRPQLSGYDIGAFEWVQTYNITIAQNCSSVVCTPNPVPEMFNSLCTILPAGGFYISSLLAGDTGAPQPVAQTWQYRFPQVNHEKDITVTCDSNNIILFRSGGSVGKPYGSIQAALNSPSVLSNDQLLVPVGAYVETGHAVTLNRTIGDIIFTLSGGWDASFTSNAGKRSQIAGQLVITGIGGLIIDLIEIL